MIAAQAEEAKKLQDNARVQTFVNSLEVILLFLIDVIEDCLPATNKFLRQLISWGTNSHKKRKCV